MPFPKLLFAFLERRLHHVYKEHPQGGLRIGRAVEQYVLGFLQSSGVATSVWNQADIKAKVDEGISCDIVATMPDCTLLIEVKATRFSRDKLSTSTIQKDTSTGTVAKAYRQLIETAKSLYAAHGLGEREEAFRAIIGLVVTAWDIPSVNSPDYHDRYIRAADTTLWQSGDPPPEPFSYYPTTMDVSAFELLCQHLANGKSLLGFFEKRVENGDGPVIHWKDYLVNISREDGYPPILEVVRKEWDAVFPVRKPR